MVKPFYLISTAQAEPIAGVPASEMKTGKKTPVKGGKRNNLYPFWAALNSVRKHLKNRLYGGVLSPNDVIIRVLNEVEYDEKEFRHEFNRKVTRLLHDMQFCKECKELGLNPVIVAEHAVFAGKTKYQLSREKRPEEVFPNGKLASMQEPMFALKIREILALPPAHAIVLEQLKEAEKVVTR